MSEEKKDVKGTEVAEVAEVTYVSTKDAFKSIAHNAKESLTDKEAWKRRGKKALKGLAIAGAVMGGLAIVDKITKPDDDPKLEEDWTDDDIIGDAEFTISDEETEGSETTDEVTAE